MTTSIELAKEFLCFFKWKKIHIFFHFHQELYWTTHSLYCSSTFCHFSCNFIIPLQYFIFLSKELFLVSFTVFQEIDLFFFSIKRIFYYWKKYTSEDSMSGEYGRWIRTSQPSYNSFCLVNKETCGLELSWWKIMCFLLTNSRCFSSSAAFVWVCGCSVASVMSDSLQPHRL